MPNIIRAAGVIAMLVFAVGCAAYHPRPLEPGAELARLRAVVPETVIVEHKSLEALGGAAGSVGPFDPSDGLSEAEVVAVALTANPDLRAKRLEIGLAQAMLITAGLWPNPEIGIGWKVGIGSATGHKFEGDVLFELLRPGERGARQSVAKTRIEQVQAEIVAQEYRLVADVRIQRLTVLGTQQELELLKGGVAMRQQAAELVRQRRKLGEGTELDISAAELELAESQRDLRKAQTRLENEWRELNRLMGLPPDYALRLEDSGRPLRITFFNDLSSDELERRVIAGRPELRAKEAAYRQIERELELAYLGQYPRPKVGPAFERELDGATSMGLGLSVELPIFNRNQGEIAEKAAQRDQVRAEYAALLHGLRATASSALAAMRRAKLEVQTQEQEILPLIKRNQDLFEGAFKAKEVNILDWIAVQQRVIHARQEHLESLVTYGKALIELEAALGAPLGKLHAQATSAPATAPASQP